MTSMPSMPSSSSRRIFRALLIVAASIAVANAYGQSPTTTTDAPSPPATPTPAPGNNNPWSVIAAASPSDLGYGHAAVAPGSDLIMMAVGNIRHHRVSTRTTETIRTSVYVNDVYAAGEGLAWAVGSPADRIMTFDGNTWSVFNLPFPVTLGVTLRAIHGTGPSNVYIVGGSGENPPHLTSVILHSDGQTWRKFLEERYATAMSVFARGDDVWVGFSDGMVIHSRDGFKSHEIVRGSMRGDYAIHAIWGHPDRADSPIWIAASNGLLRIDDLGCVESAMGSWWGSTSSCVSWVAQPPNPGNTGYSIETLLGGMGDGDAVFTAGSFSWAATWDGRRLVQDAGIPKSAFGQGSYNSLMVVVDPIDGSSYLYAMATGGHLARRKL